MKTAITTAGAAILLILISMESGARGNPYPTSIAEDEGVMMPLLRQRRDAGSCRVGADCNEWNPCCSKYGYCGTRESGHCTTPESDYCGVGLVRCRSVRIDVEHFMA